MLRAGDTCHRAVFPPFVSAEHVMFHQVSWGASVHGHFHISPEMLSQSSGRATQGHSLCPEATHNSADIFCVPFTRSVPQHNSDSAVCRQFLGLVCAFLNHVN